MTNLTGDSSITSIVCKKKTFALDGKPYRLEIWGTRFGTSLPIYMTSWESEFDCNLAKKMVTDFLVHFHELKQKKIHNSTSN
jgi:hypothetical protein